MTRSYRHIKEYELEILELKSQGKTNREICDRHKDKYSISEMCRFFGVSRSGYYGYVSRSGYYGYVSRMDIPAWDLPLAEKIRECQAECGKTYGYRRVHTWLERRNIY